MSVSVSVRSYTHSITYVSDNILRSLKDVIRMSGLDPAKLANQWTIIDLGIKTWIESGHLQSVVLEIFEPGNGKLVSRWDVEISYGYENGDGEFWTDTEAIKLAILKAGVWPATADYELKVTTAAGRPEVSGWTTTTFRSTAGMVQQSIGTTVEASGLSGGFSYYRRR
jgi:hypothetical protein